MRIIRRCSERKRPAFLQPTPHVSHALLGLVLAVPLLAAPAQEVCIKELGEAPPRDVRPMLSDDGERVAYVLSPRSKAVLVCDDKKGPVWEEILYSGINFPDNPFSQDGRRLPYQAKKGDQTFLVFAGEEANALPTPGALRAVFSPDGSRWAYAVMGTNEQWIVCDGKEGPHYRNANAMGFSPDGKRFIYVAQDDKNNAFVVLDGQPLKAYERIRPLCFSPDGKRLVFVAVRGGNELAVCDGKEGRSYPLVKSPLFSPDSQSLAYWAMSADRKTNYVIWNEKEVAQMTGEPRLAFSPDSRILGCGTYGGEMYRISDTTERLATGYDSASKPAFSPDSRHLAYALGKDRKWQVCVDGKKWAGTYDPETMLMGTGPGGSTTSLVLDPPVFSADGRHVFVKGFRGRPGVNPPTKRDHFIVCDGIEGPTHDGLWFPPDSRHYPNRLRYVVRDGDRLRLMEWAWPKDRTWQNAAE